MQQKNFQQSYFVFLNKYIHLFTKTKNNILIFNKYCQIQSGDFQKKNLAEKENVFNSDLFFKEKKLYLLQLQTIVKNIKPQSSSTLIQTKHFFKKSSLIFRRKFFYFNKKNKILKKQITVSLKFSNKLYAQKYMYAFVHPKEKIFYYNLIKVCLFVFPKFLFENTFYKIT